MRVLRCALMIGGCPNGCLLRKRGKIPDDSSENTAGKALVSTLLIARMGSPADPPVFDGCRHYGVWHTADHGDVTDRDECEGLVAVIGMLAARIITAKEDLARPDV